MANKTSGVRRKRYAVGQMLGGDFVVDLLDGPRKLALRGADGEVIRHATRQSAEAHLRAALSPGFAAALSDETSALSKAIAGRGSR